MGIPLVVAALVAVVGVATVALVVTAVVATTRSRRSRADVEARLVAAERERDDLRRRLEELTGRRAGVEADVAEPHAAEFVITHVGEAGAEVSADPDGVPVPDRLVLSATLGVPLVKAAAFSHGVRRALSAESRNRIWFEMRREIKSSRRRRRHLRRQLEREYRSRMRAAEDVA